MSIPDIPLFRSLDEQTLVGFTGRVNVLDRLTHQMLGVVILKDGQIFRTQYRGVSGLKAFYNIVIEGAQLVPQEFVVEPEIIEEALDYLKMARKEAAKEDPRKTLIAENLSAAISLIKKLG